MHKLATHIAQLWVFVGLAVVAHADAQDERFRTREMIDPDTGQWVTVSPQVLEGPLAEARALLIAGEGRKARKLVEDWLEDFPDDDRYYEGLYLLGEAYFVEGDYWKAAEQFEIVAENSAGDLFFNSVRRTMDVAQAFLAGEKRRVWKIFRLPAYDEGIELLDRVWERVPGTRLGERALKIKADYFYAKGDFDSAQQEYALLAREYPNGRYVRVAMLRSAESAEASFPGIDHDDQPLLEAAERYRQVQDEFPQFAEREAVDQRLDGIRRTQAEKDLATADWYVRAGYPQAGAYYYRLVVKGWPQTPAAPVAERRLRELGFALESEESDS